jgi:hypothetical protein
MMILGIVWGYRWWWKCWMHWLRVCLPTVAVPLGKEVHLPLRATGTKGDTFDIDFVAMSGHQWVQITLFLMN